jgi:hypothetical protein
MQEPASAFIPVCQRFLQLVGKEKVGSEASEMLVSSYAH